MLNSCKIFLGLLQQQMYVLIKWVNYCNYRGKKKQGIVWTNLTCQFAHTDEHTNARTHTQTHKRKFLTPRFWIWVHIESWEARPDCWVTSCWWSDVASPDTPPHHPPPTNQNQPHSRFPRRVTNCPSTRSTDSHFTFNWLQKKNKKKLQKSACWVQYSSRTPHLSPLRYSSVSPPAYQTHSFCSQTQMEKYRSLSGRGSPAGADATEIPLAALRQQAYLP